jgi:hypothetical protein
MAIEAAPSRWRRFWRRDARAARLTPEQRSASARKAVRARWAKAGKIVTAESPWSSRIPDTSDHALAGLLTRLRVATDIAEIQLLSEKIERVIFHKQFENG